MAGLESREGLAEEYATTTGAVLTHHPEGATPAEGVTVLDRGLIDEIDPHIAPVPPRRVGGGALDVRYRPR